MRIDIERLGETVVITFDPLGKNVRVILDSGDAATFGAKLSMVAGLGYSDIKPEDLADL